MVMSGVVLTLEIFPERIRFQAAIWGAFVTQRIGRHDWHCIPVTKLFVEILADNLKLLFTSKSYSVLVSLKLK